MLEFFLAALALRTLPAFFRQALRLPRALRHITIEPGSETHNHRTGQAPVPPPPLNLQPDKADKGVPWEPGSAPH